MRYSVLCPCCGEMLNLIIDSDGNVIAFSFNSNDAPSQEEIFEKCKIELGVVEEVKK